MKRVLGCLGRGKVLEFYEATTFIVGEALYFDEFKGTIERELFESLN